MWSFFADLFRNPDATHTVVVINSDEVGTGRRYRLQPKWMAAIWGGSLLTVGIVVVGLFFLTPLRTLVPGYGTKEIQNRAQLNAMRVQALQDSVQTQRRYIDRLRRLITGGVDTMRGASATRAESVPTDVDRPTAGRERSSADTPPEDAHTQPALSPSTFLSAGVAQTGPSGGAPVLSFPVDPPVPSGFPTRGFDAQTGHYGVDIAVSEGTYVRAVGSGFVVMADWTRDGGYSVAVQHAGGYLSVYKHNQRLLKQRGDRVRAQEPLAVSGNTGEMTTGPHLHFELWRNGLAQDPQSYVAGW